MGELIWINTKNTNLTDCSLGHAPTLQKIFIKIRSQLLKTILHTVTDHWDRQTDRQTGTKA